MLPKSDNSSISMREVVIRSILQRFGKKSHFFEGWSWFNFNNLGLTLGMTLKFYASLEKRLKLKARKFLELSRTYVKVAGEKLVGRGLFAIPILNRVKYF